MVQFGCDCWLRAGWPAILQGGQIRIHGPCFIAERKNWSLSLQIKGCECDAYQ